MSATPSPRTTVAVVLGASDFTKAELNSDEAFAKSARKVRDYLLSPSGLGLAAENLLYLFDDPRAPPELDLDVSRFLGRRAAALREQAEEVRDLIVYYTGHGLIGRDQRYVLASRFTHKRNLEASAYAVLDLANTLRETVRHARRYIILDCCFAASAYAAFQSSALEVATVQASEAFAGSGTSLLCASAHSEPARSRLSSGQTPTGMTLFTECLLAVLEQGIPRVARERLSLSDVGTEIEELMRTRWDEVGPRPEIKSPDERRGNVALVPLFPNPAFVRVASGEAERVGAPAGYRFDTLLGRKPADIPASLSPIILALEAEEEPIPESELLRTERHLTTTLPALRIDELARLGDALTRLGDEPAGDAPVGDAPVGDAPAGDEASLDAIVRAGRRAWEILLEAQPRLQRVFERVHAAARPQPVAWAGRAALLVRLQPALSLARYGEAAGPDGLLSTGYGDPYFLPVDRTGAERGLQKRIGEQIRVEVAALDGAAAEESAARVRSAAGAEVAVLSAPSATAAIQELVQVIRREKTSRTRVAIGFGEAHGSPSFFQECLARLPAVSVGGPRLAARELLEALREAIPAAAPHQAVPSLLAAFRREWVRQAWQAGDLPRLRDGLLWSTWSWAGRPLFAAEFGQVGEAAYPHLTDLRSVASSDWYFNRREGIPDCYQANALARPASENGAGFHLYLSGAGGTGKSCFLRYVYEQLEQRRNVLPVWYRVDAPSSEWELVETRLREELEAAARERLGTACERVLPRGELRLSLYLGELAANLRRADCGVDEVVLFVDQLERTFESGDEPDFQRLENISHEVIDLLKEVRVGQGVRLFIASRKQYLPDFLQSFDAASRSGLHFNVLQTIGEDRERLGFVRRVLDWCVRQDLVGAEGIDRDAAERISAQADGHPLEMMLALIHLFSQGVEGVVTRQVVDELRPWEKLFQLDLERARKDRLDWHFLLAMAHARAEIVGFEEVWWRLQLVDPELTARVRTLGPGGVLEWLWLRGHLGRTVHARPEGKDPARFLEFFHANLRDHLLRDVMSWTGETPAAWRALDRLSAAARDWEQTQQPLDGDDVRALMEHRREAVERTGPKNAPDRDVFYLLFLRDAKLARPKLCRAAQECFVFSALVREESGQWAFPEIFPDPAEQIECCERWLRRSASPEHRHRVLRFLVDQGTAETRRFLATLILAGGDSPHAERGPEIARILAQPLYAARYRADLVVAVLEHLAAEAAGRPLALAALPPVVHEFLAAACGWNRADLLGLLVECAERLEGLGDAALGRLAAELREGDAVTAWLAQASGVPSGEQRIGAWELEVLTHPKLELRVGAALAGTVTEAAVASWHAELADRLGVPLPAFALAGPASDEQPQELEVRIHGRRIAAEDFFPPRCHVLMRHWERTRTFTPPDAVLNDNEALQEAVLWLDRDALRQTGWELPMWTADEAILDWLERTLRWSFHEVFDDDLLNEFIRELESRTLDVRGLSPQVLRYVLVQFVREAVPAGARWPELIEEMQRGANHPGVLLQNLREHLGTAISESLADEQAELSVIILDEVLERRLMERLVSTPVGFELDLAPGAAHALRTAIRRHIERSLREHDVLPVVACERSLRFPLRLLVERFDPRVKVLSYTELSPELRLVDAGLVREDAADAAAAGRAGDDAG